MQASRQYNTKMSFKNLFVLINPWWKDSTREQQENCFPWTKNENMNILVGCAFCLTNQQAWLVFANDDHNTIIIIGSETPFNFNCIFVIKKKNHSSTTVVHWGATAHRLKKKKTLGHRH